MPSSMHQNISVMVGEIIKADPATVLDIGIGYGKYGFLMREYLEAHYDRVYPQQWARRIDGVEIWAGYIERLYWLKIIYNAIYIGDICEIIDKLPDYDLIIAGDVVEHIEKEKALELLKKLISKSKKKFLLSIPLGNWLNNKIVADNPYESHKSIWETKELLALADKPVKTYAFKGIRGDLGVFVYEK